MKTNKKLNEVKWSKIELKNKQTSKSINKKITIKRIRDKMKMNTNWMIKMNFDWTNMNSYVRRGKIKGEKKINHCQVVVNVPILYYLCCHWTLQKTWWLDVFSSSMMLHVFFNGRERHSPDDTCIVSVNNFF